MPNKMSIKILPPNTIRMINYLSLVKYVPVVKNKLVGKS